MLTSEFFNNEYINYANTDVYNSLACICDGFKPTQRKLFYTYRKFVKKGLIKNAQLVAKMSEKTNYLSGEASAEGVLVKLGQDFKGSNNIPLFNKKGNWGTRFGSGKDYAASRYIFTKENPIIDFIFRKEDDPILKYLYFEGQEIEPAFYIPIIPMILVNGAEGIGNGFAQKILPHNPIEIIDQIIEYLEGKRKEFNLIPYYKGFKGTITKNYIEPEIDLIETKRGYNYFHIKDLPFNYTLQKFLVKLEQALENNIIQDYKDRSNNDFDFIIKTKLDKEQLIDKLGLRQKFTENFTVVTETATEINAKEIAELVYTFDNEDKLIKKFIEIRLDYYDKRVKYIIEQLEKELDFLKDKALFLAKVIKEELIIFKQKKDTIIKNAKKFGIKYTEEHLKNNLLSVSKEKIEELKSKIKEIQAKIKYYKELNITDLYLQELNELKEILNKEN